MASPVVARVGITPVGSPDYRLNRLRFHLLSYAIARQAQLARNEGKFYIRCDDTDKAKIQPKFLESYLVTLARLGVRADLYPDDLDHTGNLLRQSLRTEIYRQYLDILRGQDLLLDDSNGAILFDPSKFIRFFPEAAKDFKIQVNDISMGTLALDIRDQVRHDSTSEMKLTPFPLVRANGDFLYNLCSPVDDGVLGVTHVVRDRGKTDLLAKQEMVRIALGFGEITYVHAPLLVNDQGQRFVHDEKLGDATLENFEKLGYSPRALVSYLLSGFYGDSEKFHGSIDDFSRNLRLERLHQSNTTFSEGVLSAHQKQALKLGTLDEYSAEFRRYLQLNGEVDPVVDPYLIEEAFAAKKPYPESASFVTLVNNDGIEPLEPRRRFIFSEVTRRLGLAHDSDLPILTRDSLSSKSRTLAQDLGIETREIYQAINYGLTGRWIEANTRSILGYCEKTSSVNVRFNNHHSKES